MIPVFSRRLSFSPMRPFAVLLFALALGANAAWAQVSAPLSFTVPDDGAVRYLPFALDFGATASSQPVVATLTTASASGLVVQLVDVDGIAGSIERMAAVETDAIPAPDQVFIDERVLAADGTVVATLVTPSYSGVHHFALVMRTNTDVGDAAVTGSIDTPVLSVISIGSLESGTRPDLLEPAASFPDFLGAINGNRGLEAMGSIVSFTGKHGPADVVLSAEFQLDFGVTPRVLAFHFEGLGTAMSTIEVFDVTTNQSAGTALGELVADLDGTLRGANVFVTEEHTGLATFRVVVTGNGQTGDAAWWAVFDGTHHIFKKRPSQTNSSTCVVNAGGVNGPFAPAPLAAFCLLLGWLAVAQRRKSRGSA